MRRVVRGERGLCIWTREVTSYSVMLAGKKRKKVEQGRGCHWSLSSMTGMGDGILRRKRGIRGGFRVVRWAWQVEGRCIHRG